MIVDISLGLIIGLATGMIVGALIIGSIISFKEFKEYIRRRR